MIFITDRRMTLKRNNQHFRKHYKPLENKKWYCGKCDTLIDGENDDLIYLGEYDVVAHLHDHVKGELTPVYQYIGEGKVKGHPCLWMEDIPQIQKLIKNTLINSHKQISKIKARDNFQCQVCGFDDEMALEVHHIVPRTSPFVSENFIKSPLNCITLCANCHRIAQKTLMNGTINERGDSVKRLGEINGWRLERIAPNFYEPHSVFKKWRDIEFL